MKFTVEELLFFMEVTKAPVPFGLFLKFPKDKTGKQAGEEAVKALQKKQFLDQNQKFTPWGKAAFLLWEEYCGCEKYLLLNGDILGLTKAGRVILIQKTEKDYEILSFDRAIFVHKLLTQYPFLCRASEKGLVVEVQTFDYEAWLEEMQKYGEDLILVGSYIKKEGGYQAVEEWACYWDQTKGWKYDLASGKARTISAHSMRSWFLKWTGLTRKEVQHGSRN